MARTSSAGPECHRYDHVTADLVKRLGCAHDSHERQEIIATLVERTLPLCDALAARYAGRGAELDDLIQVARTALVVAVTQFEPTRGRSLVAFLVPSITGELKKHFRDHCWFVRPPRSLQEIRPLATWARGELEQQHGRDVSNREVAEYLDLDYRAVQSALGSHSGFRPESLDAPIPGLGEYVGSQLTDGRDMAEDVSERVTLRTSLRALSTRDRQIVIWRFEEECTQREIAARLHVSQMQVSRLLSRIIATLRDSMGDGAETGPSRDVGDPARARPA